MQPRMTFNDGMCKTFPSTHPGPSLTPQSCALHPVRSLMVLLHEPLHALAAMLAAPDATPLNAPVQPPPASLSTRPPASATPVTVPTAVIVHRGGHTALDAVAPTGLTPLWSTATGQCVDASPLVVQDADRTSGSVHRPLALRASAPSDP